MIEALDIRVRGIVQGVGFRPFVYRQARRHIINGWVLNDLDGVFIHAEGETKLLDEFVTELHMNPPAAAVVKEVELKEVPLQDCARFEIRESQADDADEGTLVSADLATCDDCLTELFDPANRRYRYPFINCTNCGPRFTIIDELPYDRPSTSMAGFAMCDGCAREYADVGDRRFHAQPDACWECGPQLTWVDLRTDASQPAAGAPAAAPGEGAGRGCSLVLARTVDGACSVGGAAESLTPPFGPLPGGSGGGGDAGDCVDVCRHSDALLAAAVEVIADGGIVAVKGLGGFHLVCDASNPQALARLRARKRRDGKAFAVMVRDADAARIACEVSAAEESLLVSPARPIVLLRKRADAHLAAGLADSLPELGVMLPATPVQHLLLHDFEALTGCGMLVMTSGNVHDEPIVTDDAQAVAKFTGVADAILGNDRPILSRYDDSVVRVVHLGGTDAHGNPSEALQVIRRARGYAPVPIALAGTQPEGGATAEAPAGSGSDGESLAAGLVVFAAGPEQKSTFAFAQPGRAGQPGRAYVSQHIGDLEDADVYDAWLEAKARFHKLFGLKPSALACDAHPEYLSSKWARAEATGAGLPLVQVQHHHAHIASVLAEHGLFGPAIGIALDGTGYGADGAIWGGEVLLANQADYERFANLAYVPMPGGAACVKNPLRMAYGVLWAYDLLEHPGAQAALEQLGDQASVCGQMIEAGLNTPYTSSAGRMFDAVSALLGVCVQPTYEGEAAILLDAARARGQVDSADRARYAVTIAKNSATESSTAHDTSVVLLDAEPTLRAVLDDLQAGVPIGEISLRFHDAVVGCIVQVSELVRAMCDIQLVALSGGCFMNRYLVEESAARLGEAGFTVALNANLPPNDGCVSYGQAAVALAQR